MVPGDMDSGFFHPLGETCNQLIERAGVVIYVEGLGRFGARLDRLCHDHWRCNQRDFGSYIAGSYIAEARQMLGES
jgi:hypothetical protein